MTIDHPHAPPGGGLPMTTELLRPHFEKYFPIAMFPQLRGGYPQRVIRNCLKSCKYQGLKNSN